MRHPVGGEGIFIGVGFSVSFGLFVVFISNGFGGVGGLAGIKGMGDGRGTLEIALMFTLRSLIN
jgi:hypothetical protein